MNHTSPEPGGLRRRSFLKTLGAAGALTVLAGCSEASGDEPGEGDSSGGDGVTPAETEQSTTQPDAGGTFDCTDLSRGSQTFDPDGRQFQVVWDFPASFGDVEREMANTESLAGARLGHLASKQSSHWSFIIQVNQSVSPTTNADVIDAYVDQPSFEEATPLDYEGQTVRRATANMGDDHTWKMLIPGDEDGEFYDLTLVLGVDTDEEYAACADTAVAVAEDVMQSFRPNPAR